MLLRSLRLSDCTRLARESTVAAELEARIAELQSEIEERRGVEDELRVENARLERELAATNEELTLFSAAVAHDLRAPLRAINSFAAALVEDHGAELDADAKRHLARVSSNAIRMGALIDSLLALSRITRAEMKREPIDVSALARAVIADLRLGEPERRVQVTIEDGLQVDGDLALVRSMLEHLLGNAWKFSRHRPVAHVSLTCTNGELTLRDDGVGFDMQHVGTIFAPFHRLHSEKEYEGTGIGLAIVERIVRRHGGTISVKASPDAGTIFSFTLGPR